MKFLEHQVRRNWVLLFVKHNKQKQKKNKGKKITIANFGTFSKIIQIKQGKLKKNKLKLTKKPAKNRPTVPGNISVK